MFQHVNIWRHKKTQTFPLSRPSCASYDPLDTMHQTIRNCAREWVLIYFWKPTITWPNTPICLSAFATFSSIIGRLRLVASRVYAVCVRCGLHVNRFPLKNSGKRLILYQIIYTESNKLMKMEVSRYFLCVCSAHRNHCFGNAHHRCIRIPHETWWCRIS